MLNQGVLPHAQRWSLLGLIASVALLLILAIAVAVTALVRPGFHLLVLPVHSIVVNGLVLAAVSSLMVQIGCRLIRGQRRLGARLDRIEERLEADLDPDPEPARAVVPEDVAGLTPDMVALARQLSTRLRDHAA